MKPAHASQGPWKVSCDHDDTPENETPEKGTENNTCTKENTFQDEPKTKINDIMGLTFTTKPTRETEQAYETNKLETGPPCKHNASSQQKNSLIANISSASATNEANPTKQRGIQTQTKIPKPTIPTSPAPSQADTQMSSNRYNLRRRETIKAPIRFEE